MLKKLALARASVAAARGVTPHLPTFPLLRRLPKQPWGPAEPLAQASPAGGAA